MAVLGLPTEAGLRALGTSSDEQATAPAVALVGMMVTMTVPMVVWMRFRGHAWRPSLEMGASMVLPTLAAVALLAAGLLEDHGTLMMLEHVAMVPAMLVAMLLRVDEYTGHAHHGHPTNRVVSSA